MENGNPRGGRKLKKLFLFLFLFFFSCSEVVYVDREIPPPDYSYDPRLNLIAFSDTSKFIAYPGGTIARGINADLEVVELCDEPTWGYIFFDDQAVIGYEPPPGDMDGSVIQGAIKLTVEIHNRDNPGLEWDYLNVPPVVIPPDTSNDPVLGVWQVALVLDSGEIVRQWQAEFDWEWAMWKSNVIALELELYNRDNDPDAHIVWGPDL